MDLSLVGKRALVCGSSQGIGRAAAVELASLGAEVTLFARDKERLEGAVKDLPAKQAQIHNYLVGDFAQPDRIRQLVGEAIAERAKGPGCRDIAGSWHILVNNTGGPPPGPLTEATPEQLIAAFAMQLLCAQHLVQACIPGMRAVKYGRIINVISTSVKQPIPGLGVSNTVRGAVAQWAKSLAGELGPAGITVNNVLPGYTETERLTQLIKSRAGKGGATEASVRGDLVAGIPVGRFAKPEEIGAAIAFLASPAAGYVNGINLPVDGGRLGTL